MAEVKENLPPLGAFKDRRASRIISEKLIEKWNTQRNTEDVSDFQSEQDKLNDNRLTFGREPQYKLAMPTQISIDDMTEVLFDCIEEESSNILGNSGTGKNVKVVKPDREAVREEAKVLTDIINRIAISQDNDLADQKNGRQMRACQVAEAMSEFIPDNVSSVLDLNHVVEDDTEHLENIKIELTQEDIDNTWEGMIDTSAKPKSAKSATLKPEVPKDQGLLVADALSDLTSSMGNMSAIFGRKLSMAVDAKPVINSALDIQKDLEEFIAKLSEKLAVSEEAVPASNEPVSAKDAMLKAEQERMDQLKEQQQQMKELKNLTAAQVIEKLDEQEEPDLTDPTVRANLEKIANESQHKFEDEPETLAEPGLPDINEEGPLIEPCGDKAKIKKPKKHRTAEEKEERKLKKEAKKAKKEAKEAKKAKKEAEAAAKADVKGSERLQKRRKTSSGRKLSKLRTEGYGAQNLPVHTPAPDLKFSNDDFLIASSMGNLKVIAKYINDGGEVNKADEHNRTALQRAALYGEEEVIDLLISKKAKMNLSDKLGDTALHWACRGGHPEVIRKLVKSGAKINCKDKLFSTPLHVAIRCGSQEVIEMLVKLGADVNAKDREGDTPLHDAVRMGKFKTIKTLISGGAKIDIKNRKGATPLDMVQIWLNESKVKREQGDQMVKCLTGAN